jgi:SAM-dependent methyltransferase
MPEFWESSFQDKQEMWGFEPADSAISTAELFKKLGLIEILIPGFGYGRNATVFLKNGCLVTGIEISKTAIELAKNHFDDSVKIYHGSVSDMPFDQKMYDGIFCYALIHLLDEKNRIKLITDCYNQLKPGGFMVFVAISKSTATYGEGTEISKDRFETPHGVRLFFYDSESVHSEFGDYGLIEVKEISEPAKNVESKPSQKFWYITCKKSENVIR